MEHLPLKAIEWNELQVIAERSKWIIEVGLMPHPVTKEEYPYGKWVTVYKRDRSRPCKGVPYLCAINMAIEGLIRLEEELKEQWFDPSIFQVRILIADRKAARILRREEADLAANRALKQFATATKPFTSHSVWCVTEK